MNNTILDLSISAAVNNKSLTEFNNCFLNAEFLVEDKTPPF